MGGEFGFEACRSAAKLHGGHDVAPACFWFAIHGAKIWPALASRYGGPLYLVGSALWEPDPHDYDIRCVMGEADLLRWFGPDSDSLDDHFMTRREWLWLREELKRSRRLSRSLRKPIDFQLQTEATAARYADRWRLRLDSCPPEFFEAGLGDG
jgi:hypothetical protein